MRGMNWWAQQFRTPGLLPDILRLKWIWWNGGRGFLDLETPRTFNEKLQWIMLYWRDGLMPVCSDKYRAREYVAAKAGPEILNGLYGVWERPAEIDFDALPDSFALKVNHHCGGNVLCRDKKTLDRTAARQFLGRYLRRDLYRSGVEWCYKDIPRRIIAEEYLEEDGKPPNDYKFFCFNGEPLFLALHVDRFQDYQRNYYDLDWNLLPLETKQTKRCDRAFGRPARLDEMAQIARQLSADFPFVRVDLYCIEDRIRFGEMTFYPSGGRLNFVPESYDLYWGDRLQLPGREAAGTHRMPG